MPETRLNEILNRLELVSKLGGVLKWIIIAAFGIGGWVAVLQVQLQATRQTLVEIQADRKERLSVADAWRRQKDKEDVARDGLISQSLKLQERQQGQIDTLQRQPAKP